MKIFYSLYAAYLRMEVKYESFLIGSPGQVVIGGDS